MRCQTCGEELREGARFCPTCGTPTTGGAGSVTPPTVQIRRSAAGAAPEPASPEPVAAEPPTARTDPPRASRDPGAGYDPVGPARPAPRQGARSPGAGATTPRAPGAGMQLAAPTSADFNALTQRAQRLLRLDTSVFGELYADSKATIPALIFAAVVFIISGLGGMLFIANTFGFDLYGRAAHGTGEFFLLSVVLGTILALAMTVAWAWITAFLLNQLAKVSVDFLGVARVFCFAVTPLVLALLLFFDDGVLAFSWIAFGAVASLAVIGLLESVEVRPGHAWLATLAGFVVFIVVLDFLGHDTRDLAPGFFSVL